METQFIGSRKVLGVTVAPFKTEMGNDVIKVMFEDGGSRLMTQKTFDLVVSSEASDETTISDKKLSAINIGCLRIIEEYDIDVVEFKNLLMRIQTSYMENFNRAENFLWHKNDNSFVPGVDSTNNVSLLMMKEVFQQIPKQENGEAKPTNS